jgi:PKD repeat protein
MATFTALIIIRRIRYLCAVTYSFMTMRLSIVYSLFLVGLTACEPFDLSKKNFPACTKPTADIGVTIDRLDVTLFLKDQQGDIGAVGWDPGDGKGKSRLGARVTYNYEKAGTYTITMVLVNSCDDKFTKTAQITVQN